MKLVFILLLFITSLFSEVIILDNKYYKTYYDLDINSPVIIIYDLNNSVDNVNISKRLSFKVDKRVPNPINTKDYTYSGYDRGHVASDASFDYSQESLDSVYLMTNIVPQLPKVNRGIWKKLENLERSYAIKYNNLQVINIIKFSRNYTLINNKVPIPDSFIKYFKNNEITECYEVYNSNIVQTIESVKLDNCNFIKNIHIE